ncbi:MAG: zinc ribbon domain-containing protein [Nitrososphaerales archaeon]
MDCPRCGQEILDPNPRFCPKCGHEIGKANPAPQQAPGSGQPTAQATQQTQPLGQTDARVFAIGAKYYLLPLLAIVGGVIGYRAVKKRNPRVAATIFTIGLLVSLVYVGAGFEVYSRVTATPAVYGMSITDIEFPNTTSIAVTVTNQGTIEDGLESVAINNGSLWLVYGLLEPNGSQASSEMQSGSMTFGLYGYIVNGTTVPVGSGGSETVGTEGFPPSHVAEIVIPFSWTRGTAYLVAITTSSNHPNEANVVSPT